MHPFNLKYQFNIFYQILAVQLFENLFERDFEQLFDVKIFELLSSFNFSPLRLTSPRVRAFENEILVYSEILNFPEPLRRQN